MASRPGSTRPSAVHAPAATRPPAPSTVIPIPAPPDNGDGLVVSWTGGLAIGDVLAAAERHARYLAGQELPAWGEPGSVPVPSEPGPGACDQDWDDPDFDCQGQIVPLEALAGHAIMPPGPDLAGWLACAAPAELDDAALVTSITGWRKVTSWAQARELAAVAELAARRNVPGATSDTGVASAGDPGAEPDPDPLAELDAGFTSSEIALALTMTARGAEIWMDLAISLARRLPGTLTALAAGRIDLYRAGLIDQYTTPLTPAQAAAVERTVLDRAEHQTGGKLRAALAKAVLAADPAATERRRQETQQ